MVMSFSPFDIAEQEYKSQSVPKPEAEVTVMDQPVSSFSPASSFDIAEQINTKNQPETWWDDTVRDITRSGSRAVELVLGMAKDTASLGDPLFDMIPDDPVIGRLLDKTIGREKGKEIIEGIKNARNSAITFPGSKDLQQMSESMTGGYTTPRSKGEEFSDEAVKTFTGLMTGGGIRTGFNAATRLPQWAQPLLNVSRKIGSSILSESAKEGIKLYGGSENLQELGKLTTLLMTGLTFPRVTGETNPENYLRSLYQARDATVPQGTMVSTAGIQHRLQNFINNTLRFGEMTPEKRQVLNALEGPDGIYTRSQTGVRSMQELFQSYRDINRNRANLYVNRDLDRAGMRQAREYWGEVANIFNEGIEGYLGPISQEGLQLHRAANSGWAALNQGNHVSDFVLNQARGVPFKTGVATLFGGGIFNPAVAGGALAGAAAAGGTVASVDLAMRFLRNPTLRHYYTEVIQNAMRENGPATMHALKKLDDSYQKELNDPKSNLNYPIGVSEKQQEQQASP